MEIINNYVANNHLTDEEHNYLEGFVKNKQDFSIKTLPDLIMSNLVNYIDCLPKKLHDELEVSSLYIQDEINNSVEYIGFISNMIKAYCGKINLYININYSKFGNTLTLNPLQ